MAISRRQTLTAAAWSAPVILASAAVPAYAASGIFAFNFDGGGGANGYMNSTYLNFGTSDGTTRTLSTAVVVTLNVVGLNTTVTSERSFTAGSSNGAISRQAYNSTTRITTITWTIPKGTVVPPLATGGTALPDILFSFGDGLSGTKRITNKIVVTSITGGATTQPLPLDSSVVKDKNQGAVSPDGIY